MFYMLCKEMLFIGCLFWAYLFLRKKSLVLNEHILVLNVHTLIGSKRTLWYLCSLRKYIFRTCKGLFFSNSYLYSVFLTICVAQLICHGLSKQSKSRASLLGSEHTYLGSECTYICGPGACCQIRILIQVQFDVMIYTCRFYT